ncbi:MAG: glucokinase [Dokdonella sp.]|nr:glucokinase [Dokdonella sp.]MCC7255743.1 glucokinase [Dokdonella sp.]
MTGEVLIAADVGGTHARIASIVPATEGGKAAFAIGDYCKYACADYPSLGAIIGAFRSSHANSPSSSVALAIAGFVVDDAVVNRNLPWSVSISGLRHDLGLRELAVVNDFKAVAYAVGHIGNDESTLLCGPAQRQAGPLLVVGPGTGLGGAVHIPHGDHPVILATELGQATLAATSEAEFAVLAELRKRHPRVLIEQVLSGTGLVNLDVAVRALRGAPAISRSAAQISAAARDGSDPIAVETVEIFCAWFGALLGDLAMMYGAQGGIYIAGGVLPQMRDLLVRSRFVERFLDKGEMHEALTRIPVRLVDHAQLGVIGAASWYFDRSFESHRAAGAEAPTRSAR